MDESQNETVKDIYEIVNRLKEEQVPKKKRKKPDFSNLTEEQKRIRAENLAKARAKSAENRKLKRQQKLKKPEDTEEVVEEKRSEPKTETKIEPSIPKQSYSPPQYNYPNNYPMMPQPIYINTGSSPSNDYSKLSKELEELRSMVKSFKPSNEQVSEKPPEVTNHPPPTKQQVYKEPVQQEPFWIP